MENCYEKNGLIFWSEKEIYIRQMIVEYLVICIRDVLRQENRAFEMIEVESPILTPEIFINKNYTEKDMFKTVDLILRPETTMGSYEYIKHLLKTYKTKLPVCVWQHGKSFRQEQDQVSKNMRLKEFYQLEFQCIYGLTTKNDYSLAVIPVVEKSISDFIGNCHMQDSDRLPDYAEWTKDIICDKNDMEVCSISLRKDFNEAKVLEISIGTDRCIYNFLNKSENKNSIEK